jgi:hypothetical protein
MEDMGGEDALRRGARTGRRGAWAIHGRGQAVRASLVGPSSSVTAPGKTAVAVGGWQGDGGPGVLGVVAGVGMGLTAEEGEGFVRSVSTDI